MLLTFCFLRCLLFRSISCKSLQPLFSQDITDPHHSYNSAIFEVTMGRHYTVHFINGTDYNQTVKLDNTTRKLENEDWLAQYNSRYARDATDLFLNIDAVGLNFTLYNTTMIVTTPQPGHWSLREIGNFETTLLDNAPVVTGFITSNVAMATNLMSVQGKNLTWPEPRLGNPFENNSMSQILTYTKRDSEYWIIVSNQSSSAIPPLRVISAWAKPLGKSNQVQISLHFMAIVIACNLCKLFVMLQTLRASFIPRINTLGDAVSSFLQRPDPTFSSMCLLDKHGIVEATKKQANGEQDTDTPQWSNRVHRYCDSPMEERWLSKGIV